MEVYCCVKGCSNKTESTNNEKGITFHAFPKNAYHRQKWLQAIGQPNWEPPSSSHICSAHFSDDMIRKYGIKEDASLLYRLPPNFNIEASSLEVCRVCLATDVQMYSLNDGCLKVCKESFIGLHNKNNIKGLPHFVCFECSANLIRCYKLYEKSTIAQATLLDIFAENGQITKWHVKERDRKKLGIQSTLGSPTSFPIFHYEFVEKDNISYLKTGDYSDNIVKAEKIEIGTDETCAHKSDDADKNTGSELKQEEEIAKVDIKFDNNYFIEDFRDSLDFEESSSETVMNKVDDLPNSDAKDKKNKSDTKKRLKVTTKKEEPNKKKNREFELRQRRMGDARKEEESEFKVVVLNLQQQIEEFNKEVEKTLSLNTDPVYQCEVCNKKYKSKKSFVSHVACHDPIRGPVECPVCKYRFKKKLHVKRHISYTHIRRYQCKLCSKVLQSWSIARKHLLRHRGVRYQCRECAYSTPHASLLAAHRQRQHALAAHCALCGQAFVSAHGLKAHVRKMHAHAMQKPKPAEVFKCDECDVDFYSEEARRVHVLTAKVHRNKDQAPRDTAGISHLDVKLICKICGHKFASVAEKVQHKQSEHGVVKRDNGYDDDYPRKCEHCDAQLQSRAQHYRHVLRAHPGLRAAWAPRVGAVCSACGKGFQNSGQLRYHELRHKSPTVKCPDCPKLFHDKKMLALHSAVHTPDKPFVCATCGAAFNNKGNLNRHGRVHSDAKPYPCTICNKSFKFSTSVTLHVRTVHMHLPHPPRAKRSRKT